MDYSIASARYFQRAISRDEAIDALCDSLSKEYLARAIVYLWDSMGQGNGGVTTAVLYKTQGRISKALVVDLLDHAFETGHIGKGDLIDALETEGWTTDGATVHADMCETIKKRDAERAAYLENPHDAPRYCTRCGRKTTARLLSVRGICFSCSELAVSSAGRQLVTKDGPIYHRWRDAMVKWLYTLEDESITENMKREPSTKGDADDAEPLELRTRPLSDYLTEAD